MQASEPARAAVFLDRDGTLIEDVDYLVRPDQIRLIPGAAAAMRRLNERGIPVVIVTNQSAVARGLASEADLAAVHDRLRGMLAAADAHADGIYYCPHHPELGAPPYRSVCLCRKPLPGLLQRAARELGLDLAASAVIGDSLRDLEAGQAAGCAALMLVRTGHGRTEESKIAAATLRSPITVHDDLADAVGDLLGRRPWDAPARNIERGAAPLRQQRPRAPRP